MYRALRSTQLALMYTPYKQAPEETPFLLSQHSPIILNIHPSPTPISLPYRALLSFQHSFPQLSPPQSPLISNLYPTVHLYCPFDSKKENNSPHTTQPPTNFFPASPQLPSLQNSVSPVPPPPPVHKTFPFPLNSLLLFALPITQTQPNTNQCDTPKYSLTIRSRTTSKIPPLPFLFLLKRFSQGMSPSIDSTGRRAAAGWDFLSAAPRLVP